MDGFDSCLRKRLTQPPNVFHFVRFVLDDCVFRDLGRDRDPVQGEGVYVDGTVRLNRKETSFLSEEGTERKVQLESRLPTREDDRRCPVSREQLRGRDNRFPDSFLRERSSG